MRAPTDTAASDRVFSSLKARGIELSAGESSKVVPLACDLSRSDFGLGPSRLAALTRILTLVIHSAWAVNFNIPVQSFENEHIRAVHNLIQQSLRVQTPDPARFFFCSSVSAAGGTPRPDTVTEGPVVNPATPKKRVTPDQNMWQNKSPATRCGIPAHPHKCCA